MRPLVLGVCSLQLFAVAPRVDAQVQVRITGINPPGMTATQWDPPGSVGNLYVSPYAGLIVSNGQSVVLNCIDFFHTATLNRTYWANQSLLSGSLSNTRFNNLTWYLQAAWLTQQYNSPDPGSNDNRRIAIQSAIWNIFTSSAPDRNGPGNSVNDSQYWINRAQLAANWQSVNPYHYYVLTPTNAASPNSQQEFLVYNPSAVPEPATLTLLGTGLVGLAAAARGRRKRNAESETPAIP